MVENWVNFNTTSFSIDKQKLPFSN